MDGRDGWTEATVTIDVLLEPTPPVAVADVYTTAEDDDLIVGSLPGVAANDFDPNGGLVAVSELPVSGPANGTLVLASDGSFSYSPDENFNGVDSFVYELTDEEGESSQGTVTINMTPVNDTPVPSGETISASNQASVPLADGYFLSNDTDVDGDCTDHR